MANDIIQTNHTQHLLNQTKGKPEAHEHAMNNDNLNTLIIGDKINKDKFPEFDANIEDTAGGINQINLQLKTFNNQINLLNLMGDQSDKAEQMTKVVSELTQTRDTMLKKLEQTSLVLKGTQFWNTTKLEDLVLINNKGLANESDEDFQKAQRELFERAYGENVNLPSHEELINSEEQEQGENE